MSHLSRRQVVRAGLAATAAIALHGGAAASLFTVLPAQAAPGKPETTSVDLGFIALTDAAPLIIAKEKGFFAKAGMTGVELKKQTSWAVTRDNLELGSARGGIDGAHILTPMAYLLTTGAISKSKQPVPMALLASNIFLVIVVFTTVVGEPVVNDAFWLAVYVLRKYPKTFDEVTTKLDPVVTNSRLKPVFDVTTKFDVVS
jgi:hypothetical protein